MLNQLPLTKSQTLSATCIFSGQVAFVVGGFCESTADNLVEIFSPDGECQHQLAPLPVPQLINPGMVYSFIASLSKKTWIIYAITPMTYNL